MNDHQRKLARKAGKPAGYRSGGMVRRPGYEDGGRVSKTIEAVGKSAADVARRKEKEEEEGKLLFKKEYGIHREDLKRPLLEKPKNKLPLPGGIRG